MATTLGAVGVLYSIVGFPLARGWVRQNYWYGYRTRSAFASDDAWYRKNAAFGKVLYPWGIGLTVAALLARAYMEQEPSESVVTILVLSPVAHGIGAVLLDDQRRRRSGDGQDRGSTSENDAPR